MKRFSTPTITILTNGFDVRALVEVYVTIRQLRTKADFIPEIIDENTMMIELKQEETGQFRDGVARIQWTGLTAEGKRVTCEPVVFRLENVLKDEVI